MKSPVEGPMADSRVQLTAQLFEAWSSGDPDAPRSYLHNDAVLMDINGGEFKGWPAIREYFAKGISAYGDLRLVPSEFWTNDAGVAVFWTMSGTVLRDSDYGAEFTGRRWHTAGMSRIIVLDDLVLREEDYHSRLDRLRSIGVPAT